MSRGKGPRTRYVLHLEINLALEAADYALRLGLKRLLRAYGFRCTHVAEIKDEP
jgi:hypothetical protein